MEAKELMIGDWVHVEAHRGFNAQNVKVETIPDNDGDYKYGHHYGHIGTWLDGGDNDFRDVEAKHLQPIPLTPEILEKNGFVANNHVCPYSYYEYVNKEHKLEIGFGFPQGNQTIFKEPWVYIDSEYIFIQHLPCIYVHQLQHALRLCGIEKEIIL